jgi:steroid delta-isomerase-like uncharacterized protein
MSAEENKAIIRRWIEEAWNKGDVSIADEIYAPHYTATDIINPKRILRGPAGIKLSVMETRSSFPDIHFTIDHLIAEGDKVVGALTVRGTHKGSLLDIPATGKKVTFTAVDIWRFEKGKIVERCCANVDRFGLLQQLGVVPRIG